MKNIGLIDTHSHLNFKAFAKDYLDVAQRSEDEGVIALVIPGSNVETSRRAVSVCAKINKKLGKKFAFVAAGIHPVKLSPTATSNGASPIHFDRGGFDEICCLAENKSVVAIGECGIDKFHELSEDKISAQKELFKKHIDLALKLDKPLIIHNREADMDTLEVLKSCSSSHDREKKNSKLPRMVFHCFSSDWTFAQKVLEVGAYISFTGNITYGNPTSSFAKATGDKSLKLRGASSNLKVVEKVPLNRIMIETDSPYLVPEPLRSQGLARNEPRYVVEIARKIAEVKNIGFEKICSHTTENAKRFFSI